MQKNFSRLPGKHIVTWLLQCWDSGASSLELEGREAKQLGSLSREGGIGKAIGKSVRETYPFSEDVVCQPVDHHGEKYPVPEGISCVGGGLL